MRTKIILIVIIVILIGSISGLSYLLNRQINISTRHETNYNTSQRQMRLLQDKKGEYYSTIQEQQLTARELKETNDSTILALYLQSQQLRIKKRQLEHLLSVKTETVYVNVEIPIHDTLIIREKDTISRISTINTKWLSASIAVFPDTLKLIKYVSRDEEMIFLHWTKDRKFFISRWFEKRKWAATVKSMSPNSKITHIINIKVTKQVGR